MTPTNELGVIVLFAEQAKSADFEIVSIQAQFPDATMRRGAEEYRAEFEYRASNFSQHGHDPGGCDLIICWENDWPGAPLPIIALQETDWQHTDISTTARLTLACNYWRDRALRAEERLGLFAPSAPPTNGTTGGRPRLSIEPEKLDLYLERGPDHVSRRMAQELGLSAYMHLKYREAARKAQAALNGSGRVSEKLDENPV
jgi:hypothetical protein